VAAAVAAAPSVAEGVNEVTRNGGTGSQCLTVSASRGFGACGLCGLCGLLAGHAVWSLHPATHDAVDEAAPRERVLRGGPAAWRDNPHHLQPDHVRFRSCDRVLCFHCAAGLLAVRRLEFSGIRVLFRTIRGKDLPCDIGGLKKPDLY
jgi:hypothetical protein